MARPKMGDMLTVREVARLLRVHPNTLRRWSNEGRIRAYRINARGDRRFRREEIARFLARLNSHTGKRREVWTEQPADNKHGSE